MINTWAFTILSFTISLANPKYFPFFRTIFSKENLKYVKKHNFQKKNIPIDTAFIILSHIQAPSAGNNKG